MNAQEILDRLNKIPQDKRHLPCLAYYDCDRIYSLSFGGRGISGSIIRTAEHKISADDIEIKKGQEYVHFQVD